MNNEPNNKTENKQQIIFKFSSADILFGTCESIKQNKKNFYAFLAVFVCDLYKNDEQ